MVPILKPRVSVLLIEQSVNTNLTVNKQVQHIVSCTDSACLVFTEYHVEDTKPCYLIYTKIRESTPQRLDSPGTLGKAS